MLSLLSLISSLPVLAGSGPWTITEGDTSVYAGVETQRIERLALSTGIRSDDVVDVDDGLETSGAVAVMTHGIREHIEVELAVAYQQVQANRPAGSLCSALGRDTCRTTRGFAPMTIRGKWQIADELTGSPLSVSVGGTARLGQWTARTRNRTTNLGEGTTDVGPNLSLGRSGGLGQGFWSAHVDTTWLYRQSNVVDAEPPVPGSEWYVAADVLGGIRPWWSIGPSLSYFERPQGIDIEDMLADPALATDIDRFSRLRGRSVRVGGKLLIRSSERTTLVVSAFGTTAAMNNPIVTGISAGLSVYPQSRAKQAQVIGAD